MFVSYNHIQVSNKVEHRCGNPHKGSKLKQSTYQQSTKVIKLSGHLNHYQQMDSKVHIGGIKFVEDNRPMIARWLSPLIQQKAEITY